MTDRLQRIAAYKRREIRAAQEALPPAKLSALAAATPEPRGFRAALAAAPEPALIAEFKRASPSRGTIRADADPEATAAAYAAGGAAAISVLTDAPSFSGCLYDLARIRAATPLPLLRKDFMLDPWQAAESRLWGADCILIVMSLVDDAAARLLMRAAADWGLDCLVETHNPEEMKRALDLGADLIGVNSRDLTTFAVDLGVAEALLPHGGEGVLSVAESGISGPADMARLRKAGAHAFLIGEALMRSQDIAAAMAALTGPRPRSDAMKGNDPR